MGFFSRAWDSAGHEYGRQNAERYARIARTLRWIRVIAVLLFLCWMYYLGQRG
jgi:hypothetical protein